MTTVNSNLKQTVHKEVVSNPLFNQKQATILSDDL